MSAAICGAWASDKVEVRIFDDFPRQAVHVHRRHKGIGIHLLDVPDAGALPLAFQHHLRADHRRYAGGVGNRLGHHFAVALLMVADLIYDDLAWLAVFQAGDMAADPGLADSARTERGRIGQQGFQELDRHDLLALEFDRIDARHADVTQHFEVLEVVVAETHPELRTLERREILDERFEFFVVHAIEVVGADAIGARERLLQRHRRRRHELAAFPVAAFSRHFADVDLGIEVGRKRITVVATVDVDDVERVDLVEVVLLDPGGEDVGGTGIEPGTEQRHAARVLELVLVGPLPLVFELGGVERFVVGGIEVIDAGFEAGVHDRQVLVWQRDVDDEGRLHFLDEGDQFGHVVGVNLRSLDRAPLFFQDLLRDLLALGFRAARQRDVAEHFRHLCALVRNNLPYSARANDQNRCHSSLLTRLFRSTCNRSCCR